MSQESLLKIKCSICKRGVYFTTKNKKLVTRKLEYKKFCKVCRKHQLFKEVKFTA
ncbi:MAG: 50S ribosomal protein L33 [Patescibacteria group bacterium]